MDSPGTHDLHGVPAARCPHAGAADPQASPLASRTWADLPRPPSRWWGLSLLGDMRRDYLGFVERLQASHGDLVAMRIGFERMVDVFDPEAVREVLVQHAGRTVRWERGIEIFAQSFGRSVLVTEGAEWQRQRRMLQPAFATRPVAEQAGEMVATVAAAMRALPDAPEAEVDLEAFFSSVTVRVILRTLFGPEAEADTQAAAWATQVLSRTAMREMTWPMTLPDWLPLPGKSAKRRALRTLRELVARQIAARRAALAASGAGDAHVLLDRLLSLRNTEGPDADGAPLSEQEIFDQCMVSFQAGHETTAAALAWWARLMAEHREASARAQAEVDAVLEGGRAPGVDDVARLTWLVATLKEAMRLYPPVAAVMSRRATEDIVLGGVSIPKGTLLRITPWVIQRDPRRFEQPSEFRPERFLPGTPGPERGAWLPFGTGPRVCLGQHFAMLEMTLVAAMLVQRHAWSLPPGAPAARPEMNVTLRDPGGLRVRLRLRS
ncbi:cytochrome P450 [Ramlibacter sp. G-1-2-2]|uniref:Cytochrome P450 n=1 Tax=Ramlibacter agri TaxID=2728837 RepID=A0A848H3B5_9BURK|nr:cytochrome P450 [Ramlibacter agri]NML42278.1 cytochrome P450 [Ramlibacter agri]